MLRATLKGMLSRKLRLTLSTLAVVLGVMFVSGAFVLTDVWRHRSGGWRVWRRHSTPATAGRLPSST